MNVCRECRFHRSGRSADVCEHPALQGTPDPVHGATPGRLCRDERNRDDNDCGAEGKLYEPKPIRKGRFS